FASVYGNYPLIRSRSTNLYAQLGVDHKTFRDRIDSTGARSDKRADVLMASLYGEHRDQVGGGGISSASMTLSTGRL
ncbi:ShlB/FhaC/HecB family hemolysin secretion/activation protein, partial [Klebsiella pneumoniae]|nr:ShlB/FhaC/HecB family hemolysin secretion/activation protein [Klebsiella pneumoniae]